METPTAGDILRRELRTGEGKRTLARRLAHEHTLPEIERWRAVVVRAERGGEPSEEQALRVGEVFGESVRLPSRAATTTRRDQLRRLEEVEDALSALGPELARLADRVAQLEKQAPPKKGRGASEGGQE